MMGPVMTPGGTDWDYSEPELSQYFDAGFLTTNRVWVDASNNTNYSISVQADDPGTRFEVQTEKKYIFWGSDLQTGIRTNAEKLRFYNNNSASESVDIYIIFNNEYYDPDSSKPWFKYHDFIAVVRDYYELVDQRYRVSIVPISALMDGGSEVTAWTAEADTDYIVSVHLKADNQNLTLPYLLDKGYGFSVLVTDSILDDAAKDNTWGMIKNMLTFDFTGNTIFDIFISTPFYICAIYVLIRFVMAFIPFISGM
jgi:hypothetical protein